MIQERIHTAPAERTVQTVPVSEERPRKRVAAYCRVSTLLESQETSLEGQREHYAACIAAREDWEPAGLYLEAGASGTRAETRPQLQRLLSDCREGRVDLILTKSISRFARSTTDCLALVRELAALGVELWFEKENIRTGTMESELMLSILACLAEEESRSLSDNMKWGIRKRFARGSYRGGVPPYGYRRAGDCLEVDPEEAPVVREIFAAVLSGRGMRSVAEELNRRGIPTRRGKAWTQSVLARMVRSPVYAGDAEFQKTFMDGAFRQQTNRGQLDRYYVEAHHPPIVSRETFLRAAAAVRQRGKENGLDRRSAEPAPAAGGRSPFSGLLRCGCCGGVLYRQRNGTSGYFIYVCETHRRDRTRCPMGPVREDDVKNAFLTVLNKLAFSGGLSPGCRVPEVYLAELRAAGRRFDPVYPEARRLLDFIRGWEITGETEAFPAEGFARLVDGVTVTAGRRAVFAFACGLALPASLQEGGTGP